MNYVSENFLETMMHHSGKIVIVGAGAQGIIIGNHFKSHDVDFLGFIDISRQGYALGKRIYSYDEVDVRNVFFFIASFGGVRRSMESMLLKRGAKGNAIYALKDKETIYQIYEEQTGYSFYVQRISNLKNIYEGKRCFLIGNGPSLQIDDLNKLKDEYTFSCNSIFALYNKTSWRPFFYCAYDSMFYEEYIENIDNLRYIMSNCKYAFFNVLSNIFEKRGLFDNDRIFFMKLSRGFKDGRPFFSDDCSKELFTSGTVMYLMLQLAFYMGFKEIILIGVDSNYSVEERSDGTIVRNNVVNHQRDIEIIDKKYEKKVIEQKGHIANTDLHIAGYTVAKEYANKNGIVIKNATRGGRLDVFERISFDSLF